MRYGAGVATGMYAQDMRLPQLYRTIIPRTIQYNSSVIPFMIPILFNGFRDYNTTVLIVVVTTDYCRPRRTLSYGTIDTLITIQPAAVDSALIIAAKMPTMN